MMTEDTHIMTRTSMPSGTIAASRSARTTASLSASTTSSLSDTCLWLPGLVWPMREPQASAVAGYGQQATEARYGALPGASSE